MWRKRTEILIGAENTKKLEKCSVAIIGIGGVGGYVCQMLARAGVGNLTIVDFDTVDVTNINRQIIATTKTVGKLKTHVMKKMILEINPMCNVDVYDERFCVEFAAKFFTNHFDYVVDAIDSTQDKLELISYCKMHNINIVSAMGAGNRKGIPDFKIMDIFKTSNDGLAKVMRKKLRERGISSLDVAIASEIPIKTDRKTVSVGSISYYPAMCGCVLGAFVINNLIEK